MNVPSASDNTIFIWLFSISESFFETISDLAGESFLFRSIGNYSIFELALGVGLSVILFIRLIKFLGDSLPG